jgi:hypothetical protein
MSPGRISAFSVNLRAKTPSFRVVDDSLRMPRTSYALLDSTHPQAIRRVPIGVKSPLMSRPDQPGSALNLCC